MKNRTGYIRRYKLGNDLFVVYYTLNGIRYYKKEFSTLKEASNFLNGK